MPLHEYECQQCGRFEKIQKFSDKPLKVCPTCGKRGIERLLSAPAIQFKGSGWYITDYARKSEGKPEAKGDGKSTDAAKSDGGDGGDKAKAPAASSDSSKSSSTPNKDTSKKSAATSRRSP